ncbi:MAG TPA: cation:proton antiporter [Povalibacter sp.]|uniref:cation:proton antiporter n=1 Tax=Povalibacter sp. TaxID=1962978 RepID=UPI002CC560D1|nr:cation:proton antiporter [Povalibacter sp.]HMN44792.1 cation:proton antiporter [Povalibacter sp.]
MSLIVSLFLLLGLAHGLGTLARRFGLPALAGHMIAGILVGPSVLGGIAPGPGLGAVADIAVFFVVLTAGLEMRLQHVTDVLRGRGALSLFAGFAVPVCVGGAVAFAFELPSIPAIVVALCIAVTALPVALQILSGFNMLGTRIASVTVSGALLSDILVFLILGVLIELSGSARPATEAVGIAFVKLAGLVLAIVAAQFACVQVMKRRAAPVESTSNGASSGNLAFVLLFVLGLGALSELLGFHFAIGAFFAAMMVTPELIGDSSFDRLERTCDVLTASLFGPVFLAYQGLQFHLQTLSQPAFIGALIVGAVVSKMLSGYLVGRMQGMSKHDAWGVGIVMNARGVMELVIASIAFRAALVDGQIFSALLIVGLVTTVLTPLMLRAWQR